MDRAKFRVFDFLESGPSVWPLERGRIENFLWPCFRAHQTAYACKISFKNINRQYDFQILSKSCTIAIYDSYCMDHTVWFIPNPCSSPMFGILTLFMSESLTLSLSEVLLWRCLNPYRESCTKLYSSSCRKSWKISCPSLLCVRTLVRARRTLFPIEFGIYEAVSVPTKFIPNIHGYVLPLEKVNCIIPVDKKLKP